MPNWKNTCGKALLSVERRWLQQMAAEAVTDFGDPVIVNIGIFRGASMYCLRAGAPKARLVGFDTVYPQGHKLDRKMHAEVIRGDSGKLWRKFEGPVHLLFVDGDHTYEGVMADITGWAPKIALGGVIAFHDFKTAPAAARKHAGIKRAVLEWEQEARWHLLLPVGSLRAYRRPKK